MKSTIASLGFVQLGDAVATRIGSMLRERLVKECRSRGPIGPVAIAYRRSMIA